MRNCVEKLQIFGSSQLLQNPVRHTIKYWKWVSIWIYKWCKEHCVLFQSHQASSSLIHVYTVEPLWKGQECLTKVAKFCPFPRTILYKSCLFYPSWQATSFERPPFWVAFIEGFHCIWMAIRRDFTCRDRNTSDVNWIAWLKFYADKIKSAEGIGVSTNSCKEIVYKMCILNSISDFQTEIANIKVGHTKWKVGITSAEYT